MSNIEKLLDSFIKLAGDELVIVVGEPIYVLKDGKKMHLMKKPLGDREFYFMDAEYSKVFEDQPSFTFNGCGIETTRDGNCRRFFWAPGTAAGQQPLSAMSELAPIMGEPMAGPKGAEAITGTPVSPPVNQAPTVSPPPIPPEMLQPDSLSGPPPIPGSAAAPPPPPFEEKVIEPVPAPPALDLDELLKLMMEKNSSDLHLTTSYLPMLRIDGDMHQLEEYPEVDEDELYKEMLRIAPERNITEFEETNDTDFAYAIEGYARFRANLFRDTKGVGAVFRIIPTKILTVEQLDVPWAMVKLCEIPKGLILVTGPTGSGKSTTLAALIDHINTTQPKHIITIEDPVEFVHPKKKALINQREIHSHTLSFKRSLRAALREDPDIILVGEMRDLETIAIAIEMAVTGHLVFGTLHTSTAIGTIDRIIDQFPSDQQAQIKTMLADALIGVCAQTLPKKIGGGRVGAYEVLVITNAASNLIREGKNFQIATIMQTGKGLGMQMINTHLTELVEKKIISAEEAILKAVEKDNLKSNLKNKGLYSGT